MATALEMWRVGDVFVDVREPSEYVAGHVAGAINVPIGTIPGVASRLPAGQLVTLCSRGGRAGRAADQLAALGRTAVSIAGGTSAWAAAGLPVVTGEAPGSRR